METVKKRPTCSICGSDWAIRKIVLRSPLQKKVVRNYYCYRCDGPRS